MILDALATTARDIGIGLLIFAALVNVLTFGLACIAILDRTPKPEPTRRGPALLDLDDWLADEEPLEEFRVWKHPEASAQIGQRVGR